MPATRNSRSSRSRGRRLATASDRESNGSDKEQTEYSYHVFTSKQYGRPFKKIYNSRFRPKFAKTPELAENCIPKGILPWKLKLKNLVCMRTLGEGCDQVYLAEMDTNYCGRHAIALKSLRWSQYRGVEAAMFLPNPDGSISNWGEGKRKKAIISHFARVNSERASLINMPWSPWVTGMYKSFRDAERFYLGLEYIPGGTLRSVIIKSKKETGRGLSIADAQFYFANIVMALSFVRKCGLVHCDVKPDNILVGGDGYLVLTDFGGAMSTKSDKDSDWKGIGTVQYMPPEVTTCGTFAEIQPQENPNCIDAWSLGVVLYEMVTGCSPFYHRDDEVLARLVCKAKLRWPKNFQPGSKLGSMIAQLLQPNPELRLQIRAEWSSASGSKDVQAHPWLSAVDWDKMGLRGYLAPYIPPERDMAQLWHTLPLPKAHLLPGLKVDQPSILQQNDDRFSEPGSRIPE